MGLKYQIEGVFVGDPLQVGKYLAAMRAYPFKFDLALDVDGKIDQAAWCEIVPICGRLRRWPRIHYFEGIGTRGEAQMKSMIFLFVSVSVAFASVQSFAQDINSWGDAFSCSVDWFAACFNTGDVANPKERSARTVNNPRSPQQGSNLPEPVRNVLENPSPETARAYVLWSRQASERLSKATEYIAQATREINSEASRSSSGNERRNDLMPAGIGPVGLYYFFSPAQSSATDVAVLNKIWREGRIGVVGIPVRGNDEEIARFVNEARPLFPVRKSDAEVKLVKPVETPDLYLALPLERRIFRLGPTITEKSIVELNRHHPGRAI